MSGVGTHGPDNAPWQKTVIAKQKALANLIPTEWKISQSQLPPSAESSSVIDHIESYLTPFEQQITSSGPQEILVHLSQGLWSAVEVCKAFCHRAAIAHQLNPCLSEIRFEEALAEAAELDVLFRSTGRLLGPLHGLPISLKDRYHLQGFDTSCGYVSWLNDKKARMDEGYLVQSLRQAGALLFVKTNVPMSLLVGETVNNIIGSTLNPYNFRLTAGGASGGEAALLAMKGSPAGWGSDIAGSIRIPCAFNELYGLRPTSGRLSATGLATSLPGLPLAGSVVGPMCASLPFLLEMTKWFINSNAWQHDFEVIDMPWNEARFQDARHRVCRPGRKDGNLTFALMETDDQVSPHPPVRRAMRLLRVALQARGYEVIDWNPPAHGPAVNNFLQILGATAGDSIRSAVNASGEPPIPQLSKLFEDAALGSCSATEFWILCAERERFRNQYHQYWRSTAEALSGRRPVDGVILPIAPHAAPPEGHFNYHGYSIVPSLLDYPTGVVPVTRVDNAVDLDVHAEHSLGDADVKNKRLYDRELFHGAPVGVQIMGQRFQEEKVLVMMEALRDALQGASEATSGNAI